MKKDIYSFIKAAMAFGVNYIFVDKGIITDNEIAHLKEQNYSVVVGQGEVARVKISW